MKQISKEIFYPDKKIVTVDRSDIEFLKQKAFENERKRSRLCAHQDVSDALHEMLIIHTMETYVHPHKHLSKSESLTILEGSANVFIFDETGAISEVIQMGDYQSGKTFYYRISESLYHTLIILSKVVVFHEATNGPFNRADTIFAPWAPEEKNVKSVGEFTQQLKGFIEN